ncbi:MAG: hypothetical protein LBD30_05940 [Verrucomicrobiales bacterium]|jgi:hypothetical protein|nr:hypothetical protein [Verrucomicrobiales bacterium]
MKLKLKKVQYKGLTPKQQENYNFHKLAAILADYGFDSIRLANDWEGADFLALHNNGDDIIKVQLKGRLEINKKYTQKNIYMAFPLNEEWYLIPHDELKELVEKTTTYLNTESWINKGEYNTTSPNEELRKALEEYKL